MYICKYCGCEKFDAVMIEYHDCIVDGNNEWLEDLGCYESEKPDGLYTCRNCGAEADYLDELVIESSEYNKKTTKNSWQQHVNQTSKLK